MTVEPIIYSRNYIDSDCDFNIGNNSAFFSRAYDGDKRSTWFSVGAASDLTSITNQIDFYEAGVAQTRSIDTLILLNHNLANVVLQWSNGLVWTTVVNTTGETSANKTVSFTPVNAVSVRMLMDATQTANAEKSIGEMIVCAVQLTPSIDAVSIQQGGRSEEAVVKLADGSMHRTVVKFSQNRSEKYECKATFEYLTATELETFRRIKDNADPFLWQPESVTRPDEVYLVNWVGQFAPRYMSSYKSAGFQLVMDLKEV